MGNISYFASIHNEQNGNHKEVCACMCVRCTQEKGKGLSVKCSYCQENAQVLNVKLVYHLNTTN